MTFLGTLDNTGSFFKFKRGKYVTSILDRYSE